MATPFSSDMSFFEALRAQDPLGAVVRAHIHIEARLSQAIEATFPKPNELPTLRFEQRVRLALALGLDEALAKPLLELGRIRNAFSHRLDADLTDGMVKGLFNAFNTSGQEMLLRAYDMTNEQVGLANMPTFHEADVRLRFIAIAVALDTLVTGEGKILGHRVA